MNDEKRKFSISNLGHAPGFRHTVADRIWNAWWRDKGYPIEYIIGKVEESLSSEVPLALVAHEGSAFFGTASVVASDMEARPQYTPWVAAVWVEPQYRSFGIGSSLVKAAAAASFERGYDVTYLCASPANSPFYERLGWQRIEKGVTGLNVFRLSRES